MSVKFMKNSSKRTVQNYIAFFYFRFFLDFDFHWPSSEPKKENSSQHSITYDISQLFDYIDNLTDLSGPFSVINWMV